MKEFQVKDVADIINGFAFESELFNNQRIGLPVVRIRDVVRGFSKTYYSGKYEEIYEVKNGDLLIGMDGEFNIARWKGGKALLNQRVCKIVSKPELAHQNYLKFRLKSVLKEIEDKTPFATVKHLSSEELKKSVIQLPNPGEQKRIAAILDQADRLRRQRRFAQTLSDSFLQSVFIKMFGEPLSNPMNWTVTDFDSQLDNIDSGNSPICEEFRRKNNEWAVLRLSAVTSGRFLPNENKVLPLNINPVAAYEVKKGDILFTRKNTEDLVAACALVFETSSKLLLPDTIFRFKLKPHSKIKGEFLWSLFNERKFRKTVQALATGSAGSMPNISKEKLKELQIPIPPLPLQEKFAEIVQKFERVRRQQREATRQAEHLFQTLLHRAFRGEL